MLALHITPANVQDRAVVAEVAAETQEATDESVQIAWVDQGYTGEAPAQAAQKYGIKLHVVKLPQAKKGLVMLPRR